jgi:hypothetical protein
MLTIQPTQGPVTPGEIADPIAYAEAVRTGAITPIQTPWCCESDCKADATTAIIDPTRNYDESETHACAEHVEALGGDVPGNTTYTLV